MKNKKGNKLLIVSVCCLFIGAVILDCSNLIGMPVFFLVLGMFSGIIGLVWLLWEWLGEG